MESEALNPFGIEASGDRKELGHARHVAVESSIEARHLWQLRMALMEHLHELNTRRHVFGIVRADPVQLGHQLWGDALGLVQFQPARNDTMADPGHCGEPDMTIQPANQKLPCGAVIGGCDEAGIGLSGAVVNSQSWLGQADALDLAGKQPRGWRVRPVEGELRSRGPAANGQHAASRLPARPAAW